MPVCPAFLPLGFRIWFRTCLPGILHLCFSNQCLNALEFALLSSSSQPGISLGFFFVRPFDWKKQAVPSLLHTCPQLCWPLWYFNFFFIGPLHTCWLALQLRSRNFHVVLGERVSPPQWLPQPRTASCRNSLAALGNRSVWNNIVSLRSGKKKCPFYTVVHTLLKRIPQSLVCSPLSHSPPALPFS